MPIYNIYPYINAQEDVDPSTTVEVSDDGAEIVSIKSHDPASQEADEQTLRGYIEAGFTPVEAIERYAGSYGEVAEVNQDGSIVAAAEEDGAVDEAPSTFEIGDGLMAMVEDDGTVVTLLRRDPNGGSVYRSDGEWKPLVDPTALDGLSFVGVTDSAEAVYDRYFNEDKLVKVGHYFPSADGPYWPYPVQAYDEPETAEEAVAARDAGGDETKEEEPEVATEPLAASVRLDTADDLTSAIAAAVEDPEIRWYVERRIQALGLEADLPWQEG